METYYRREQEDALVNIVHYVRDTIQLEIWNNAVKLREFAEIGPDSELWTRFLNRQFIDVPVGPLMLSEALFLAQEEGWNIIGKAEKDEKYLQSTEANHDLMMQKQRDKSEEIKRMFESTLRPKDTKWTQGYNRKKLSTFVPAFQLMRESEKAYISWLNEAYTLPSGEVTTSLWENLVLDRANMENSVDCAILHSNSPDREFGTKNDSINQILCNNEPLEINQVLFYNSGLDLDIHQRIKVKRFWE